MVRIGDVVITGPVLEQVAEQIQLLRVPRMLPGSRRTPCWWQDAQAANADRR
jgi:hypothetical protein